MKTSFPYRPITAVDFKFRVDGSYRNCDFLLWQKDVNDSMNFLHVAFWISYTILYKPIFIPFFLHPLFTIYDAYMRKLLGFSSFCPLHLDKFWLQVKNSLHIQTTYISTFCNTYAKHTSSDGDYSGKSLSWRKTLLKTLLYHLTQHHF